MPTRHTTQHPIAKRLKEARLESSLSQAKVGELAGIDPSVASARMNQYERQVHQPAYDVVRQLAEVLKKPVPFFSAADDSLAEVLAIYGRINSSDRAKLIAYARKLSPK
ncbi:MAG: helix-turn-helix transcriptional regulator [Gammaproteobacteria bacterium]